MRLFPFFFILFSAVLIVFGYLISDYMGVHWHEQAHQQINKYAGYNSTINIYFADGGFSGITTRTTKLTNKTQSSESLFLAHSFNESIGYTMSGFLTGIWLLAITMFSLFLIYSEAKNADRKHD